MADDSVEITQVPADNGWEVVAQQMGDWHPELREIAKRHLTKQGLDHLITSPEEAKKKSFSDRIESILSKPLTDDIDSYADDALDKLIGVVSDVVTSYDTKGSEMVTIGNARETKALEDAELDPETIEISLESIARIAEKIRALDEKIDAIRIIRDFTILPTNSPKMPIPYGLRTGEAGQESGKQTIPRLKTIIFILESRFGINLEDNPGHISIENGLIKKEMVRTASYNLVTLPTLNRSILVCDEVNNATFVFDLELQHEAGISNDELMGMTKEEIEDFVEAHQNIGRRIAYNKSAFVSQMISLIEEIPEKKTDPIEINEKDAQLLKRPEAAPEGWKTVAELAEETQTTTTRVRRAMARWGTKGVSFLSRANLGRPTALYLSPEQIAVYINEVETKPDAPERTPGRLTVNEISAELGLPISNPVIYELLKTQPSRLERVSARPSPTYTLETVEWLKQQDTVIRLMELQKIVRAPEDVVSANHVASPRHIAPKTVESLARKYHMPIGEYRFGSKTALGYSSNDRDYIDNHILPEEGYTGEAAVEGVDFVMSQAAYEINTSPPTLRKVIGILKETDPNFGKLPLKIFEKRYLHVLSKAQLDKIDDYITSHNMRRDETR